MKFVAPVALSVAGAGYVLSLWLGSPAAQAACTSGEEEDVYTTTCTPFLVPNSPSPFSGIPGNPDLPAVNLPGGGGAIPCTGHNAGECIGLAEEDAAEGPQPIPRSTISASP
ncbi:intersectin-EH binding protein Ibp1 [Mycolicibacterium farcinogenes]|uniref:Intersectin-EH binding protein Ibp1 n=2 Tax=Mycolicibacterium TaxID=1866885 RepID=A0A378SV85_9MYCO|nr:hypothetical protein [Mycolicibacterium senegalense]CDP88298.1 intersectin-EH binding protein Ibp1 [Mycolicibacterium farcinogenes]CQD23749.1 intersectin-EH binding protein Ibp1 [Mycolicibacterium conceptionense]STZ51629.1 intersectin-EH binding protein Ibp1 [Mycolicibacterium senegalense]